MKILVTGGCGYIGSHTVVDLLKQGFEVVIADNCSTSSADVLQGIEKITGILPQFHLVDLKNLDQTEEIFKKNPDIQGIIHFAAYKYVDESVKQPLKYFDNNLNSLLNILKMVEQYKIPHFVFSSSCSVYGNIDQLPVSENNPLNEAQSPYARTKQMGEQIIEDFKHNAPTHCISLRYFNPVGAHESGIIGESPTVIPNNLVPRITGAASHKFDSFKIFGTDYPTRDGTCIRDYIHVMDIAAAHTLALQYSIQNKHLGEHEIINLGSGNGVTVKELIQAFVKTTHQEILVIEAPRREGDVAAVYADNSKAKKLLNWSPDRSIESMMESAWNWELQNTEK